MTNKEMPAHDDLLEAEAGQHFEGGNLVESVWSRRPSRGRYLVLPDGATDLLFRRKMGVWRGFVVGPMRTALIAHQAEDAMVGLRLSLGTARRILGRPLHELVGAIVPLEEFDLGDLVSVDELVDATHQEQALRVWGGAMAQRLPRRTDVDVSVRESALRLRGGATHVRMAAREAGTTERTLHRWILTEVGISPKRLSSVGRLERALAAYEGSAGWAHVAVDAGYSDQSHLAREFKMFTGRTPGALATVLSDSFKTGHLRDPIVER